MPDQPPTRTQPHDALWFSRTTSAQSSPAFGSDLLFAHWNNRSAAVTVTPRSPANSGPKEVHMRVWISAAAVLLAVTAARAQDGWVAIFNGKDLEGWQIAYGGKGNKDNSTWKVVDGVIVGEGEVSHLFSPRGDYENFEVRAELMISDKGNSGFYFRTAFGPGFPKGYEAQVNATHGDPVRTGSIYNHVKVFKQLHKPDTWFKYHLKVVGNQITVTVDGDLLYTYVDPSKSFAKGHFAFQQHNLGSVVKIKSLEVKELPGSKK